MKVNVEIDCTPEEARRFMGLPDVTPANEVYVNNLTEAMKGAGSFEQMQELGKQLAPMGQMGMQLFEQFLAGATGSGKSGGSRRGS